MAPGANMLFLFDVEGGGVRMEGEMACIGEPRFIAASAFGTFGPCGDCIAIEAGVNGVPGCTDGDAGRRVEPGTLPGMSDGVMGRIVCGVP